MHVFAHRASAAEDVCNMLKAVFICCSAIRENKYEFDIRRKLLIAVRRWVLIKATVVLQY